MSDCFRDDEGWWLKGRHLEHPSDWVGNCVSCQPCPERHCGECQRGAHLGFGENTCIECIGKVRRLLRQIVELAASLPEEAQVQGVHSEAANLNGPFADPEAFAWRRAARADRSGVLISELAAADPSWEDDEHHPCAVLKRFVQALEEDYGDPYDRGDDLASLTDWIDARLHRIANDYNQDFGQFKREVGKVVAHLEAVLHAGEQVELGVQCLSCHVALAEANDGRTAPKLRLVRNDRDVTGASDKWQCPIEPGHWWSEADYRLRVGADYLEHADHLTAADMHRQYGIKPGTLRKWAERGEVEKRGHDDQGRMLYDAKQAAARAKKDEEEAA